MYAWNHLSCILGIICRKKLEMIPSIQEVCFDYMQNLSHLYNVLQHLQVLKQIPDGYQGTTMYIRCCK